MTFVTNKHDMYDIYDWTLNNGYGIDLVDSSILKSALINNFFKLGQTTDKL